MLQIDRITEVLEAAEHYVQGMLAFEDHEACYRCQAGHLLAAVGVPDTTLCVSDLSIRELWERYESLLTQHYGLTRDAFLGAVAANDNAVAYFIVPSAAVLRALAEVRTFAPTKERVLRYYDALAALESVESVC